MSIQYTSQSISRKTYLVLVRNENQEIKILSSKNPSRSLSNLKTEKKDESFQIIKSFLINSSKSAFWKNQLKDAFQDFEKSKNVFSIPDDHLNQIIQVYDRLIRRYSW